MVGAVFDLMGVDFADFAFEEAKYAELVVSSSMGSLTCFLVLGVDGFLGFVSMTSSSSSSDTTFR